jgi:hypothetical protein
MKEEDLKALALAYELEDFPEDPNEQSLYLLRKVWIQKVEVHKEWQFIAEFIWQCLCKMKT